MTNIEELVANSILNEPKEVVIGGVKMMINKPKTSTLIAASKYIGKLPNIPIPKTQGDEFEIALAYAGECGELIGYITAILVLGRKNMYTEIEEVKTSIIPAKRFLGITYQKEEIKTTTEVKKIDNVVPLAEAILDEYSNGELKELISELLSEHETNFFLDIIISLSKANLLRPKKKEIETTASGL